MVVLVGYCFEWVILHLSDRMIDSKKIETITIVPLSIFFVMMAPNSMDVATTENLLPK